MLCWEMCLTSCTLKDSGREGVWRLWDVGCIYLSLLVWKMKAVNGVVLKGRTGGLWLAPHNVKRT